MPTKPKKPAAKKTATRSTAAKSNKTSKKTTVKAAAPTKKVASKKTTTAKPIAKKTSAAPKKATTAKAKPVSKKAPAKTTTAAKKPAKKTTAAAKKPAKKTTVAAKKPVAKKPTSAKKAPAKTVAKKAQAAKATAKPPVTKTTTGKKDVAEVVAKKSKVTEPEFLKSVGTAPIIIGDQVIQPYHPDKDEEYMNAAQREHFKFILDSWKTALMQEVDRTVSHMKDEAANFPDPNDRASQEEEFSIELRTRDRERKLIRKIEKTLERLKNDDYGFCDVCGIEIGLRRLEARPTATLCIDCKTLDEIKERQVIG